MNNEAVFRRYCRQIRSLLPCSLKDKHRILREIRERLADYREQNPEADAAAVLSYFGAPEVIAAAYIDQMGTAELLKKLRIRRRILTIALTLAGVILVTWLGTVAWAIIVELISVNGYIVVK